jgi:5-methylcytosine-specific restriction protein B
MNDIDRSVESMDFAFRRRFTFIEIKAKDTQLEILNSIQVTPGNKKPIEALVEKMDSLNKAIYDPKNSTGNQYDLSEAYHIGAAYFKHYEDYAEQDKPFDKLWDNHLKGVLFEYLRGKPDANKILDNWKKAYNIFPAKK